VVTHVEHADSTASAATPGRNLVFNLGIAVLCQTELQEPLHCKYLGTQRPSRELRMLEKVDSMFTFLPVYSREYGSAARVFRPGTRAVHSGHAE
jgi:hypothetical protein